MQLNSPRVLVFQTLFPWRSRLIQFNIATSGKLHHFIGASNSKAIDLRIRIMYFNNIVYRGILNINTPTLISHDDIVKSYISMVAGAP